MRHRVEIETPIETQDDYGGLGSSWESYCDVWAQREDLSGGELFQAQQINAEVSTQFTIRYRSGIDARMRVISDDVCYGINSVQDPDGRREKLLLLCSRSVNE